MMKYDTYCKHIGRIYCGLVSISSYIEEMAPHIDSVKEEMSRLGLTKELADELINDMFKYHYPKKCGAITSIMDKIAEDCNKEVELEAL